MRQMLPILSVSQSCLAGGSDHFQVSLQNLHQQLKAFAASQKLFPVRHPYQRLLFPDGVTASVFFSFIYALLGVMRVTKPKGTHLTSRRDLNEIEFSLFLMKESENKQSNNPSVRDPASFCLIALPSPGPCPLLHDLRWLPAIS